MNAQDEKQNQNNWIRFSAEHGFRKALNRASNDALSEEVEDRAPSVETTCENGVCVINWKPQRPAA